MRQRICFHFFETDTLKRETQYHNIFKDKRIGKTELFTLNKEDIELFKSNDLLQHIIYEVEDSFVSGYKEELSSYRESNKDEVSRIIESSSKTNKESK